MCPDFFSDLHHFCNTDMETARCCPDPRRSSGRRAGTLLGCPILPSPYHSRQTLQRSSMSSNEFYDVVITSEGSPGAWCKLLFRGILGDKETNDTGRVNSDIESVSRSPQDPWHVLPVSSSPYPVSESVLSLALAPSGGPGSARPILLLLTSWKQIICISQRTKENNRSLNPNKLMFFLLLHGKADAVCGNLLNCATGRTGGWVKTIAEIYFLRFAFSISSSK